MEQAALANLAYFEPRTQCRSDDREGPPSRREVEAAGRCRQPQRPHASAREVQRVAAVVEPRGRHRAPKLGQRAGIVLAEFHEREDRLRVDGHLRLRALDPVPREKLVVVGDDPVVDPDDRAVTDGVVVGLDVRVSLGEVPDVDQRLKRVGRHLELVEERAGAAAKLGDARAAVAAMGVADGVGPALGDAGEQRLRSERPVD